MSNKSFVKLSETELLDQVARLEKREDNLKFYGLIAAVVGVIGTLVFTLLESPLSMVFFVMIFVGAISFYRGTRLRKKAEAKVQEQLGDFNEAELISVFGPRAKPSEMPIDQSFLERIRPLPKGERFYWDRTKVWSNFEGNYHGTCFSAADVELYYLDTDERNNNKTRQTVFKGLVLRCKDVCDPALDIALYGCGEDHRQSDLMDPAVFRQLFSACTADDQPADGLVTPQLRELVRKLETLDNREIVELEVQQLHRRLQGAAELERKHKKLGAGLVDGVQEDIRKMEARTNYTPLTSLILRDGEATLAINGFSFAYGVGDQSLQNLDLIRRRFTVSLPPVCEMIDILRDHGGKL